MLTMLFRYVLRQTASETKDAEYYYTDLQLYFDLNYNKINNQICNQSKHTFRKLSDSTDLKICLTAAGGLFFTTSNTGQTARTTCW